MAVDIVGDIHGHASQLVALLKKLGYAERGGAWRHPDREVIFVGDFIDRGLEQLKTLNIVRAMIDGGAARAVMGNHEFNAIGWATPASDRTGDHLRTRRGPKGEKNRKQHAEFLAEVGEDSPLHREWVEWFKVLPLWIDALEFRVVHACWSDSHASDMPIDTETPPLLLEDTLPKAFSRGAPTYEALEILLKGLEIDLPEGFEFIDKDGISRNSMRVRWWLNDIKTYQEAFVGPSGVDVPDVPLPDNLSFLQPNKKTFIGHYWFDPSDGISPASSQVACVDYSVARGGKLVAYRFDGEPELSASNFVMV
jgi:hypothetical protein